MSIQMQTRANATSKPSHSGTPTPYVEGDWWHTHFSCERAIVNQHRDATRADGSGQAEPQPKVQYAT